MFKNFNFHFYPFKLHFIIPTISHSAYSILPPIIWFDFIIFHFPLLDFMSTLLKFLEFILNHLMPYLILILFVNIFILLPSITFKILAILVTSITKLSQD
jgi:hypothetical protein